MLHLRLRDQSLATSAALVRSLSRPGELICDLFVGSGTVPAAVALVGEGRRFAGQSEVAKF